MCREMKRSELYTRYKELSKEGLKSVDSFPILTQMPDEKRNNEFPL